MAHRLISLSYSYNPNAGGGPGNIGDGSVSSAKLGGDVTNAGKSLLTAADASAQRTALGLGTAATSASTAFAAASHTHAQGDVTGLTTALAGKADTAHTHTAAQISDSTTVGRALLTAADASAQRTALGLGTAATSASGDFAATNHSHTIANVTGLQSALDGKAASSHTHAIAEVTNLQTTLDGKAASTHSHAISDVTGLQTALDGKAASSHTHTAAQISDSTSAGRTLLTAADASAQRTALGLGNAALSNASAFQSADATLTALAGLNATVGLIEQTGADTFVKRAIGATNGGDILTRSDADGRYPNIFHNHAATEIISGTIATARLGSGTANSTTFLRGDNTWATPAGGSLSMGRAILSGTQANSTVTPAVLTGATFTLTPGQTGTFTAILIVTAAATTTGVGAGFRVAQGAGANANARGAWSGYVNLSSAAAATGLADGDTYDVAGGASNYGELLGTATTSGNNAMQVEAVVINASTNANTTVTFEFRSEVASSAVTAQIGSGVTAVIGL